MIDGKWMKEGGGVFVVIWWWGFGDGWSVYRYNR